MTRTLLLGCTVEIILVLAGLRFIWRLLLSRAARAAPPQIRLSPWPGAPSTLLLFFILAIGGGITVPIMAGLGMRHVAASLIDREVWSAVAFQTGLLGGIILFHLGFVRMGAGPAGWQGGGLRTGVMTFVMALPVVYGVAFVWQSLLGVCGFTVREQDVVELFDEIHSPSLRLVFAAVALVIAPITEELIFRAGLFRFLRGRMPRWIAILASAVLFGASHLLQSPAEGLGSLAPLIALGVVFAIAYERTGRIGTTMVAHALFNFNTLLALWLGIYT